METIEFSIARHCVESLPDSGLSPLQDALINNPAPVRIANAPTGAGKSYAFERAMIENNKRILFIVPTRRLCQNLAASLLDALTRYHGWSKEKAQSKIALWNADESRRLREAGETRPGTRRVREVTDLNNAIEGGEMIIAVPEVVTAVLLRSIPEKGISDTGVFELLASFEHIVFDEFHTISPRGFGLAGLLATLAATYSGSRARVSFLSATPLNITSVLHRLGIPENRIARLDETLTNQGRAVHGNVKLTLCKCESMVDLVRVQIDDVVQEKIKKRQVVIIYDKLIDLQNQLPELERIFRDALIEPGSVLLIDSIDDSREKRSFLKQENTGYFATGRNQNPEDFDVLVATASVEMGVTFRADILFMEPGFEAMNFLQRYGRAARGDYDGHVRVRYDDTIAGNRKWFRTLKKWMTQNEGHTVAITELTEILSKSVQKRFNDSPEARERYFGNLSNRAAFVAGLFWNVLMNHFSNKGHRWRHLKEYQPKPARRIYYLLQEVRKMESSELFRNPAKKWCKRFEYECRILRDIEKGVRIVEDNGKGEAFIASATWLQRNTDILYHFPLLMAEDGTEQINISKKLGDYLLDRKNYVRATRNACFPHTELIIPIRNDAFVTDHWCREFRKKEGSEAMAWDLFPNAMRAAEELVCLTGLIVSEDSEPKSNIGVI